MSIEELKSPRDSESCHGDDEKINEDNTVERENCEDELTDCEIDHLKRDLLYELSELEWEFKQTKESLYNERIAQVENKLIQARAGNAPEFLHVVALVEETYKVRLQVAKHRMGFAIEIVNKELDNELQIAECAKNERLLSAEDQIRLRLQENLCKLQIEHQLMDSGCESGKDGHDNSLKFDADLYIPGPNLEPRKKPISLSPSAPRLIYQLPEEDIRSDVDLILEAVKKHKMVIAMTELNGGKRVC